MNFNRHIINHIITVVLGVLLVTPSLAQEDSLKKGAPVCITMDITPSTAQDYLSLESAGGTAKIINLEVNELKSIYEGQQGFDEEYRPQFHYSAEENWLNDPNGLVYYEGTWHLFHQYNPYGNHWGYMHWNHATSTDLVHWEHQPVALTMNEHGDGHHVFSGSAAVDHNNTSGFQTGENPPIIAAYTVARTDNGEQSQNIAYSNDGGFTFEPYENNPVIPAIHGNDMRDPKIFWYEPDEKWIMIIYQTGRMGFWSSTDLKNWGLLSTTGGGWFECPDFFKRPVDGDSTNTKWVMVDGDGSYKIGTFDGESFMPESSKMVGDYGVNYYATQSWNNTPNGRRIQIAWMRDGYFPGMPFNQQMSFPVELSLRTVGEEIRLCKRPVKTIESLHNIKHSFTNLELNPGDNPLDSIYHDLLDIRISLDVKDANQIEFNLRGHKIVYDATFSILYFETPTGQTGHVLEPEDGMVNIQILMDRSSIEVFGGLSLEGAQGPDAIPENETLNKSIQVSPNPFKDHIEVTATTPNLKINEMQLFNTTGQSMGSQKAGDWKKAVLKTTHLTPGLYTIRIRTDKGVINRKLIKL
ncbi:MAG: T9SS type A sorting domain-containing protein [Bacteroidales bacterium]|nr:T9SS type A sorting domain-containing protein [Bacteroidales bacterium]